MKNDIKYLIDKIDKILFYNDNNILSISDLSTIRTILTFHLSKIEKPKQEKI
jgi:hypothetical protein